MNTMSPSRFSQLLKILVLLVVTFWLLSSTAPFRLTDNEHIYYANGVESFVSTFLSHEPYNEFDVPIVSELCASKNWTSGLVLSCEPAPGGLEHVRNAHLNCIRFAIEMGGWCLVCMSRTLDMLTLQSTAELVVPGIIKRDDSNIRLTRPYTGVGPVRGQPFDYLFDFEHLRLSLSRFCPQMRVHRTMDDLYNVPSLLNAIAISLPIIRVPLINGSVVNDTKGLSRRIRAYTDLVSPPENRTRPVRFHLATTQFAFPTASDGAEFARQFGRVVRAREDARSLAAVALYNLQKYLKLLPVPQPTGHISGPFVGLHLRTEEDQSYMPPFKIQAPQLLSYAKDSGMKVAFLATGTKVDEVELFSDMASELSVTVLTKWDVLYGGDLRKLRQLTWDQRALIDYEIMLHAGLMAGMAGSSFVWSLALRRGTAPGAANMAPATNSTAQWQDSLSTLFGTETRQSCGFERTIWP